MHLHHPGYITGECFVDSKHLSSVTDTLNLCNFAKQNYLQMLLTCYYYLLVITFLVMTIILIKTHISDSPPY